MIERGPRPTATMPDCTSSLTPNGSSTRSSASQLVGVAGGLDDDGVRSHVDHLGAEELDGLEHLRAGVRVRPDLDQQQLALHRGRGIELDDLQHVHQLVQLLGDLLERQVVDVDHDRHA